MPFEFIELEIKGVYRIKSKVFKDNRGYFTETYKKSEFASAGIDVNLNQDNQPYSIKGSIRGLHFQRYPYAQGKLIRVIKGKIFDVGVDLRKNSKTYGKYVSMILDDNDMEMLWLPEGFAHGFLALEDSIVNYKTTSEYNKESEAGLRWNDPAVNIKWPEKPTHITEKDEMWPFLPDLKF
ncbi:dTDP-4-dehydrorhamnose 3,5-epimerase [Ferroplasma sp.]|uniref:dTDP-4-dehydrorhamnose 3,5-epimerase n=1 Tax=Ferroplasma sp. TaxID=2591003 RepID=UPI002628994B|nr:dTDP-4-dehydrorhamnose 3,5-epimerase [Ferroplasma sp.]